MGKIVKGQLTAQGKRFALIVPRFNEFITQKLLEGAEDTLVRHQAKPEDIDVYWVPGAFELPGVAARLLAAARGNYAAVICLGAIIQGDTPHFQYIAGEVSKGIAQLSLKSEIPVVFGVLTTETIEQAIERAGTKAGNKGKEAAETAIELVDLYTRLRK